MNGFEVADVAQRGRFARLLARRDDEAAFAEIRNLLAVTPLQEVAATSVRARLQVHCVPAGAVRDKRLAIYRTVVKAAALDGAIAVDERAQLRQLAEGLDLDPAAARAAELDAAGDTYRDVLVDALADGSLSILERDRLAAVAAGLSLTPAQVDEIYKVEATKAIQFAFSLALEDRRYSEQEEARLRAMAHELDVTIQHPPETAAILDRFRLLARIDKGDLPIVATPLRLSAGETCHASLPASHCEMRAQTQRINYSGPTASIRICKGVRWRMGSMQVQRVQRDVMTTLDTGVLYVTSTRLLFDGANKNATIALPTITGFTVHADALQVSKSRGRDAYFLTTEDPEVTGAVLNAVLR